MEKAVADKSNMPNYGSSIDYAKRRLKISTISFQYGVLLLFTRVIQMEKNIHWEKEPSILIKVWNVLNG